MCNPWLRKHCLSHSTITKVSFEFCSAKKKEYLKLRIAHHYLIQLYNGAHIFTMAVYNGKTFLDATEDSIKTFETPR